jgi:antirestriction protein ArdC
MTRGIRHHIRLDAEEQATMNDKQSVYDEVTQRVIAQLEAGVLPWVQPWKAGQRRPSMPYNITTGKRYRGINVILLWMCGPPGAPAYMTYKQAEALGANVRRGEKGYRVVYVDRHSKTVTDSNGEEREESYMFMKRHTVFHVSQIDGLPAKHQVAIEPDLDGSDLIDARAAAFIRNADADLRIGGDRAFYDVGNDYIRVPPPESYFEPVNWHRTALHELAHWTGARSRLARDLSASFGTKKYAQEELIAEMGAAFLCASLGIVPTVRHADYIGAWLAVLKEDNKAIFKAAAGAQQAADYLYSLQSLPIPASRALTVYRPQLPAAVEPTWVRRQGGLWTVEVKSPVHGLWIVQGEHRSRIAAEVDRLTGWWQRAA